jgi:outer membrane lipase/esterase
MPLITRTISTAILGAFIAAAPASADGPFSDVVVFGDSLSDNGNLYALTGGQDPLSPPYWEGRFSNGPVWIEHLASDFGFDAGEYSNFAVGSYTSRQILMDEVHPFLSEAQGRIEADALYVVWGGANDLLAFPPSPEKAMRKAVSNMTKSVRLLAARGAEQIMVPNMPNLGRTPLVLETGDPNLIGGATALSFLFNQQLAGELARIERSFDIDIIEVDTFLLLEDMVANPANYGLTNVTDRALLPDGTIVPNPDEYLFWDMMHPTRVAHQYLYGYAMQQLGVQQIPLPATALIVGVAVLPLSRRRRAA